MTSKHKSTHHQNVVRKGHSSGTMQRLTEPVSGSHHRKQTGVLATTERELKAVLILMLLFCPPRNKKSSFAQREQVVNIRNKYWGRGMGMDRNQHDRVNTSTELTAKSTLSST